MDFFVPIVLLIVFCIFFSICGWCCKRHKAGIVYGRAPPVAITTQHVGASPVVVPPYPVDPQHPTPQPVSPPPPGFSAQPGYQTAPYPTGYPPGQPGGTPYPPQPVTPYPPAQPAPGQLPPPYHEVVGLSGPPAQVPNVTKEAYAKQAPYNPNF